MKFSNALVLLMALFSYPTFADSNCAIPYAAVQKDIFQNPQYLSDVSMQARSQYCQKEDDSKWQSEIIHIKREWLSNHVDVEQCTQQDIITFENFLAAYKIGIIEGQKSLLSQLGNSSQQTFCR